MLINLSGLNKSVNEQTKYETGIFDLNYSNNTFLFNPTVTKTKDNTILWVRKSTLSLQIIEDVEEMCPNNSI